MLNPLLRSSRLRRASARGLAAVLALSCCPAPGFAQATPPPPDTPAPNVPRTIFRRPAKKKKTPRPPQEGPYRLQPGDQISVAVTPQKGFDTDGLVLPDGMIYLDNVGPIQAAGLTIDELTAKVKKALEEELLDPRVTVVLTDLAPEPPEKPELPEKERLVTVVGAVKGGGQIVLEEGLRLRKAIDLAGGPSEDADLTQVSVIHDDLTRSVYDLSRPETVADPKLNIPLREDDSVDVPHLRRANEIVGRASIIGQVEKPGLYDIRRGMTLVELVVDAGKLTPLADVEKVVLRRGGKTSPVNFSEQIAKGLDSQMVVEAGDEVFVPEAKSQIIVIGGVAEPGPRPIKPGQTLRDFLTQGDAGTLQTEPLKGTGIQILDPEKVDLKSCMLIRRGQKALKLNLENVVAKGAEKENVQLASGDILYLTPRFQTSRTRLPFYSYVTGLQGLQSIFNLLGSFTGGAGGGFLGGGSGGSGGGFGGGGLFGGGNR
jgi:protein involved in polysaccharide export with SLBB domain